jgi:hypothetical protein
MWSPHLQTLLEDSWRWCTIKSPCGSREASLRNRGIFHNLQMLQLFNWTMWIKFKYAIWWGSCDVPFLILGFIHFHVPLGYTWTWGVDVVDMATCMGTTIDGEKKLKMGSLVMKNKPYSRKTWCYKFHPTIST